MKLKLLLIFQALTFAAFGYPTQLGQTARNIEYFARNLTYAAENFDRGGRNREQVLREIFNIERHLQTMRHELDSCDDGGSPLPGAQGCVRDLMSVGVNLRDADMECRRAGFYAQDLGRCSVELNRRGIRGDHAVGECQRQGARVALFTQCVIQRTNRGMRVDQAVASCR